VVVSNRDGSITSSTATLTVLVASVGFRFGTEINGGIGIENASSNGITITNVTLALPQPYSLTRPARCRASLPRRFQSYP